MPLESPETAKAKVRAIKARYYQRHKKECQKRADAWWKAHPEKLRAKWRRSSIRNKAKKAARRKQWRLENLEIVRRKNREWQSKNRKHRQAYMRNYYEANKETFKENARQWTKDNPEKVLQHNVKQRACRANAINPEAIREFCRKVKSKKTAICYYCNKTVSTKNIHFDHVVPLSKGGAHRVENLCVSCAFCNLSKRATPIHDWYKLGQQILSL